MSTLAGLALTAHGAEPSRNQDRSASPSPSTPSAALEASSRDSAQTTTPPSGTAAGTKPDTAQRPARLPVPRALRADAFEPSQTESVAGDPDITTSLDTTAMSQQIRAAALKDIPVLVEALNERIALGERELIEVKRMTTTLRGQQRKAYRAAFKELRDRRTQLVDRISEAKRAKPDNWPAIRDALAVDYQAYWVTMTRVSTYAGVGGL